MVKLYSAEAEIPGRKHSQEILFTDRNQFAAWMRLLAGLGPGDKVNQDMLKAQGWKLDVKLVGELKTEPQE
jgi:hypothetical protein